MHLLIRLMQMAILEVSCHASGPAPPRAGRQVPGLDSEANPANPRGFFSRRRMIDEAMVPLPEEGRR
jgi:hypothetical protein